MAAEETPEDDQTPPASDGPQESVVVMEEAQESGEGASPYKNLLIPLVVVPALIVVVLLLGPLLFGSFFGKESTLEENLHRVLQGGSNERSQAAFALVEQLAENNRAILAGEELPWEVSDRLAPALTGALDGLDEDDAQLQYVLSSALLHLEDPAGLEGMRRILAFGEEADPGAELRFHALLSLGIRGEAETIEDIRAFLIVDDAGLRSVATGCLRFYPAELALPSLREAMGDHDLAVRLNAAIGLSWLGDPGGAILLRDGARRDLYEAERERDSRNYARADIVRENRVRALEALARLGRAEDRAFLEDISAGDDDLEVREAAMRALKSGK